jgi:hypothetical protein
MTKKTEDIIFNVLLALVVVGVIGWAATFMGGCANYSPGQGPAVCQRP